MGCLSVVVAPSSRPHVFGRITRIIPTSTSPRARGSDFMDPRQASPPAALEPQHGFRRAGHGFLRDVRRHIPEPSAPRHPRDTSWTRRRPTSATSGLPQFQRTPTTRSGSRAPSSTLRPSSPTASRRTSLYVYLNDLAPKFHPSFNLVAAAASPAPSWRFSAGQIRSVWASSTPRS